MKEEKKVTKKKTTTSSKKTVSSKKTSNVKKETKSTKKTEVKKTPVKRKTKKIEIESLNSIDSMINDIEKIDNDKTQVIDSLISDNVKKQDIEEERIIEETENNAFKKNNKRKKFFMGKFYLDIFDILIVILITAIISCVTCGIVLNNQYKKNNILSTAELKEDESLSEFIKLYSEVKENYYEDVDSEALIEAASEAMIKELEDKYSIYISKDNEEAFNDVLDGTYTGIGILANANAVLEVYADSPAEKAGIEVGDVIIKINDTTINEKNYSDISKLIQEHDGESSIVVKRGSNELTFSLKAEKVTINMTTSKIITKNNKNIGYIGLSSFTSKSAEQFAEALVAIEKEGIDSLIIDLRGNSGGYLSSMETIASLFIEKGKNLYGIEAKDDKVFYEDKSEDKRTYSIVVLVNKNSASASEMLTAALKESYGATVVGKTTYGKGTAQKIVHSGNTTAKYTAFKWLTPSGECIDGVGIKPDYEIDNTVSNNIVYDKQFDKALDILSK